MNLIEKFLARKDYVGTTIVILVFAIIALWNSNQKKEEKIFEIQEDFRKQSLAKDKFWQQREDLNMSVAKQETAELYRKAFNDQEDRIQNLEQTIEDLLSKSSLVSSKYNKLQRELKNVSGNQEKIEQVIPRR